MTVTCCCLLQWRSRTFGRPVRWSNLPPFRLRFWKLAGPLRGEGKPGPRDVRGEGGVPSFKNNEKGVPDSFLRPPQICINSIFGRDSAPDPAGGAYDTPRTPKQVVRGQ